MATTYYSKEYVQECFIDWINDIMIDKYNTKYEYIGTHIPSDPEYRDKSFLVGQLYIDNDTSTCYIFYTLDPNIIYKDADNALKFYNIINDHLVATSRISLLSSLKIEFLFSTTSSIEWNDKDSHGHYSKCRTEETNRKLYDDTIAVWRSTNNNKYAFIRDSNTLINDKHKVYTETGKGIFNDYHDKVEEINSKYDFVENNDSVLDAFNEYKVIYKEYFNRDLKYLTKNDVSRFVLLATPIEDTIEE